MPVTITNLHNTKMVMSTRNKNVEAVEWAPAGDLDGDDVQQVSDEMAQSPSLIKAIALGLMEIDGGDDTLAQAIEKQKARFQNTQRREALAIEGIVQSQSEAGVIRFTEDELNGHFDALSKQQKSTLAMTPQGA